MTTQKRAILLATLAAVSPSAAFGLGIRIADQDPHATARGNAFAATADNPSAIYYNPAGITQLEGHNFRVGFYGISLNSDYEGTGPAAGISADTKDEINALPQIYYTVTPPEFPLSFGLGVYSPYGLALEWSDSAPFFASPTVAREGEILYLTFNPVVAWKICDTLSIAVGPTFNYADAELITGTPFGAGRFKFAGDDSDVGFNAGILWQPHEQHSFGVNYRSATEMNFSGSARTSVPGFFFLRESASARFQFPQNVVVGWSYRPTTNWNLEVNIDWTDWDSLDTVTLRGGPFTGNVSIPFNWKSSFFYEFGVTRYFDDGWRASAGYIYSENSVPQRFFNPVVPDSDRHIFSVGVGRQYERVNWDIAYQFAWGPERTINNGTAADGRYEFTSHAVTATIGFNF